jgi:hypothetical protein
MRIKGNGNVGIGTASPVSKLQVSGVGGIRAHVNSDSNAGLGLSLNNQPKWSLATVNPGQFQIFNDAIGANALWIDGTTNNVGIGVANPGYALDLGQRMRLRHGGFTAGLWFNNSSNNEAAFVGMEDDTHIGIYGNGGAFWKFGMNTVTGALRVDGSEGQAGQVLTSRGSGAAAQWKSPTSQYQLTNMNINSGTTAPGSTPTTIPGLAQTISVSGNAKLLVQWGVRVEANDCCFGSTAWIDITLNGGVVNTVQHSVANNSRAFISGSWMMAVGPGSHTVEIKAWSGSGAPLLVFGGVGGIRSNLIVQVIPE